MNAPVFDADAEYAALNREAAEQITRLLDEAINGKGVKFPRREGGTLLMTKPSPGDEEEVEGKPLFRVTAFDEAGSPFGHTVISAEAYREFRASPELNHAPGRLVDVFQVVRTQLRPDLTQGIAGITLKLPTEYMYQLRSREHGIGTSPTEGLIAAEGRYISYDRPLSRQELKDFEAIPVGARPNPTPDFRGSRPPLNAPAVNRSPEVAR